MTPERAHARVTVVIPVWDRYVGDNLVEAILSVATQGVPVETIVVDNASDVALPPLGDVEVMRLERRHTTGGARNAAVECLRTPYVLFLDADDRLLEGALTALVAGLDAAAAGAAYTLSIVDAVTGRRYRSPRRLARALSGVPRLLALANAVWSLLPTQGCMIMRVHDVRACGGYADRNTGEDWVLGTSLAFRGKVLFDKRPGLAYRRHQESPGVAALSLAVLLDNARAVRERIREDPGIPRWVQLSLPLIAVAQSCAARIAHPAYRSLRTVLTGAHPE